MRKAFLGSLVLLLAGTSGVSTPVDKVISLLTKLSAQVQAEGVAEAASYDKYACFCKEQADDKVYVIAKSDKKIEVLDADIKDLDGQIVSLNDDVKKAKEDLEKEEKTQTEKQKARSEDQETYAKKRKSLEEAVDAVSNALETMRSSRDDVEGQISLLMKKLPPQSPALALIAGATGGKRYSQPKGEAKSYQYASKEVIATLTSLSTTFKKELAELDKAEMDSVSDYEMAAGARANTISALNKEINEKETLSASKGEEKADKEELKSEETKARNADQKFLNDLTAKCEDKAKAWDTRSTTRASELTALAQAVELLKGMGNLYESNTKLVGLVSKGSKVSIAQHKAPSFFQLRSQRGQSVDEAKLQQLSSHLREEARSLNSAPLALLALRLQNADPDHFVKVRGIIKDLISKLEADAKAEATAKTACDKNMKAAVEKRDKHAAIVETAGAQIDSTKADINNLKKDISDLAKEIADLNKFVLESTELRTKDKAQNELTIANADQGKVAVDSAIEILKKFYEGSFIQAEPKSRDGETVGDLAPETFDSKEEYKGKTESSKGIIGMLEVISADFERTSKATTDGEADAAKDYENLKADTEKDIKDKEKLKTTKETDVETKTSDLTGFEDDKRDAMKMNEQALEELEKLQASCVDTGVSYAERAAHRKEEIEALKQALQILEDWK